MFSGGQRWSVVISVPSCSPEIPSDLHIYRTRPRVSSGDQQTGVGKGVVVSTRAPFRVLTTHHLEKITEK